MTDKIGARAHDYRASGHPLGICLIQVSSFPDSRSRIQGLLRVGRHNDKCWRIQKEGIANIDAEVNSERSGKLFAAVAALEKQQIKQKKKEESSNGESSKKIKENKSEIESISEVPAQESQQNAAE
jgi:hypothetical protein